MKTRTMFSLGLSALVVTGTAGALAIPAISIASSAENAKRAASEAKDARKAMAKRKADKAVEHAEAAVGYAPRNAEYRALLGQSYLLAGRFVSARQAFADALSLDPSNGAVALNLALAEIAAGDWAAARNTLEAHSGSIAASDRGLAFALAGDPVKGVEILTAAAREPGATPKTRQNLALSFALAGRWQEAKSVAAVDVSPEQLDARIMQWAAFSRPANAYDQVASLLGVRPVQDGGQPVQLALVNPTPEVQVAEAPAAPVESVDAYMPGAPDEAAVAEAAPEPQPAPVEVAAATQRVVFGPRAEIVQAVPVSRPAATPAPVRTAALALAPRVAGPVAKGKFYVQLGAYVSPAVARDAWRRTAARVPEVGRHTPQGARVSTKAGNFYRLSVGGFARADADSLCRTVRASGGNCFVRVAAGDQLATWAARSGTQVAAR